jgi:plastocyanin
VERPLAAEDQAIRPRHLLLVGLGALVLSAPGLGCGGSGHKTSGSSGSNPKVAVADFSFSPKTVDVKVGQTVTWTNQGQTEHTIKGPGFFSPRALGHGEKYTHRVSKPGRFPYLCTLHPTLMRGSVVVR